MDAASLRNGAHTATAGLQVRLFAALRDQAGWDHRWLPLTPEQQPITPTDVWGSLQLPGQLSALRIAINHQFASADTPLQAGDELAFLPPISGG